MKRLVPVLAVVVACLVLAPIVFAQSRPQCDPGGGGSRFFVSGTVTAVDTTTNVLSVAVDRGCPDLSGTTVDVVVTGDTQLFSAADHHKTAATLADVAVGDKIAVCGTIDSSSGTAVYTAGQVFDFGAAASLPTPVCRPGSLQVAARHAGRGDALKLAFKVTDPMPGAGTANVTLALVTVKGKKLASVSVSGVSINTAAKVSFKLHKALAKGTYRIVARATDWAGNKQVKAATATLKVN